MVEDCAAVVQQTAERRLEPAGCGARLFCEQLQRCGAASFSRFDSAMLESARLVPPRLSWRKRRNVFCETAGWDERAIQLNEHSKAYNVAVSDKPFAAGSSAVPFLP
jgi:hypothetical protein